MKLLLALAALAFLAPAGLSGVEATHHVALRNSAYDPQVLQVAAGDTVVWTDFDGGITRHTVTAYDGSFGSPELRQGDTFRHTFTAQGVVPYHCLIHGRMIGVVVVL